MYEKFYGFTEKPFQLVPNPNFLYLSSKHQNALTYLEYGLSEGAGFILLTGDIGAGKTTLIRHLLNKNEKDIEVGVIFNTNVESNDLLALALQEFGLSASSASKAGYLEIIFQYLVERYSQGKRVLLIIDEAQNLSLSALEEVRMLSNLQTDDQLLLQVMLVGQPELKRKLSANELVQLSQRIGVHYHLGTLSHEETQEYIAYRLQKVGGAPDIFDAEAVALIFEAALGVPRIVNLLCDTALVYAYADSLEQINSGVVAQVILDKEGFGLIRTGQTGEAAVVAAGNSDFDDHSPRIAALEARVNRLQVQVEGQLAQANQAGVQSSERLISELTRFLEQERKKTERLLLERGTLLAKIEEHERRSLSGGGSDAAEVAEHADIQMKSGKVARAGRHAPLENKGWYQRLWVRPK